MVFDIEKIAKVCQKYGIIYIVDFAHSIGSVPSKAHEWGIDAGVFCTYKYLNAGGGNIGGLFVHSKHSQVQPAFKGWYGTDLSVRFKLLYEFTP